MAKFGSRIRKAYPKIISFIKNKPFASFFTSLSLLLFLIILGNFLFKPKTGNILNQEVIKEVSIFKVGSSSQSSFSGQVEKAGIVKIIAQSSGIVQSINISEGDHIGKGTNLIQLSTNYQGSNLPAVQTAIAAKSLDLATENLNRQKEIIAKQKDITNQTRENTENLRQISNQSISETQSLIDSNNQILNTLNNDLKNLINTNTNDVNHTAILQTRQAISQFQAGLNQAQASLRALQFQADVTIPPTVLADLQKEVTLKQLDLQEKALQLNKDIAQLQLSLASINESLLHPTAPFTGTVDRIFVHIGQAVNPGTVLLQISSDQKSGKVIAKLPGKIALNISLLQPSTIHLNGLSVSALPIFVSQEATDGQLYSVIYSLPEENLDSVADGQFLTIDIPVGYPDTNQSFPFIPLDAVFQTQTQAFVYIVKDNQAISKQVELGTVLGKYVGITSGLGNNDQVILNRNVIAGDKVKVI